MTNKRILSFSLIIILVFITACSPSSDDSDESISIDNEIVDDTEEVEAEIEVEDTLVEREDDSKGREDVPVEYKSALKKAEIYSKTMHMSKVAVYDQLTSEHGEMFSHEAGQYAIDNIEADWNANALAKAKVYQDSMAMSPEAIREQLMSEYGEKFTKEEADYAIDNLND